jgi:hypothetical protein
MNIADIPRNEELAFLKIRIYILNRSGNIFPYFLLFARPIKLNEKNDFT